MLNRRLKMILAVPLSFLMLSAWTSLPAAQDVPRITKEELKAMLGKPEVIIVDVRTTKDWNKSQEKIQGAVREDPEKKVKTWANKYPHDKTLIFYCA